MANSGGDVMQNEPPPCWLSTRPTVYITDGCSTVEFAVEGDAPSECLRTETSEEKVQSWNQDLNGFSMNFEIFHSIFRP